MPKLKITKNNTVYRCEFGELSDYDYLEITQAEDKRITVKWNDMRWRSVKEAQKQSNILECSEV